MRDPSASSSWRLIAPKRARVAAFSEPAELAPSRLGRMRSRPIAPDRKRGTKAPRPGRYRRPRGRRCLMSIFSPYELVKKIDMACHSSSWHTLLQHPAPVPCVIAVDRRVWLARVPACLPFVQRDDALPSGMRRIDTARYARSAR